MDLVLAMSVHPGFGGQSFMPEVLTKIRKLTPLRPKFGDTRMEIDGGVGPDNAADVVAAGVDMIVAGSAIFSAPDPAAAIAAIKAAASD